MEIQKEREEEYSTSLPTIMVGKVPWDPLNVTPIIFDQKESGYLVDPCASTCHKDPHGVKIILGTRYECAASPDTQTRAGSHRPAVHHGKNPL